MSYVLCAFIFRFLLPVLVITCIVFRPSGLSALYLILLLLMPWMPVPTNTSMKGSTGLYLKLLIMFSVLTSILQIAFQVVLFSLPPYAHFLQKCDFLEKLLRHVGLVQLDALSTTSIVRWLSPEIIMLVTSIGVFVSCRKLTTIPDLNSDDAQPERPKRKKFTFLVSLGRYVTLASLCLAAVLRPSIPGGFYFLVFLSAATWWGCYKELNKAYAIVLRFVLVFVVAHIGTLYGAQFQWFQEILPANSIYSRYFGLTQIMSVNCSEPRDFILNDLEWASYVNPLVLIWLYYVLVIESRQLLKTQIQKKQGAFSRLEGSFNGPLTRQLSHRLSDRSKLMRSATTRHRWQSATRKVRVVFDKDEQTSRTAEKVPLIKGVSQSKIYGSVSKARGIYQDSTGSVTITGEESDDIPMNQLGSTEEEEKTTCLDDILIFLENLFEFITKSSYIATNIIMMTWSITYHCWLTFVLLLWANLLWMIPNQRRSMLRSSPFLVLYAWFLLISAYIYSMDLTEEELPSTIKGINLAQIGFVKISHLPCNPLLVKCLYTTMFWITLRQFMQERKEKKQSSALADMVAPLQVTVGTATGVNKEEEQTGSPTLKKIGAFAKKFLTKFWIWVVAVTLFAVAITGQRMTIFRILYMALFLFFIVCFQISFRVWRKIMFLFWLTVIIYSMLILVLVYTYQFDNFPQYWEDYLHVGKEQQLDIGLERYDTKLLFVRLATPTFFVIVTVIQLHYFHKDFMEMSDPEQYHENSERTDATSAQGAVTTITESDKTEKSELFVSINEQSEIISAKTTKFWSKDTLTRAYQEIQYFANLVFLFLELHMPKFVLLIGFLVCTYDKCAMYFIFVVLVVFGVLTSRNVQHIAIFSSSVLISIMLLLRMIYQINYVQIVYFETMNMTCDNVNASVNVTKENAEWLGFYRVEEIAGKMVNLPYLVRWNIIYIIAVSLWSVIMVRQRNFRISGGKSLRTPYFMFSKIKRTDADKNIRNFVKYMFNYGYYKFGVEICLLATVALIGFRMDFYSILYSVWLCGLFALNRDKLARVWNIYLVFIAVLLIIQYIMVIGLPRGLCIDFPWSNNEILRRLQEWGFIMDYDYPLPAKKLICDFVLLLLVSRQAIVFRIEKRFSSAMHEYPGGSNESIIHHAEEEGFVNPVPDFVTYITSYLDALKRAVLLTFLWTTLAVVFLAGTNRVNLFSIGYLIGSFVFLWQGTDLYLKPIPAILRSWNWLLGYNVCVILIKSVLQLVGCIFIKDVQTHACWLVQLLGIGCVRKFSTALLASGEIVDPSTCSVPREYIGLAWDGVCFGMLLMQRRIFMSYNFFHMIDEIKATSILASRGAELIGELRQKRMAEQEDTERRIIEKIRTKMERIKANQQRIQGPTYQESNNHFVDGLFTTPRPRFRKHQPKTYKEAIRSGDYYMFDEMDDEELDIFEETKVDEDEDEQSSLRPKTRTIGELLSDALKTNIASAVKNDGIRRRASMPFTRQRSSVSARSQLSVPLSAPPTIHEHHEDEMEKKEIKRMEPKPGTSKDEDLSDVEDQTEPPEPETCCQKFFNYILFAWAFIEGLMMSAIHFLNRHSKDYRYVIKVLTMEKKLLKESTTYNKGVRPGRSGIWYPLGSYHTLIRQAKEEKLTNTASSDKEISDRTDTKAIATPLPSKDYNLDAEDRRKASVFTVPEIRILAPSLEQGLDSSFNSESEASDALKYETEELSSLDQPTIIRLFLALWYIVMSHSDLMCYFVIFLNQIKSATFLSLPLPLMVFFWGSLTVPRPSKTFWVTIIAYTEIIVLVKCMFQFEILPWNQNPNVISPFYPPKIIGIERTINYAVYDLQVLLMVFFHRFMLKSLGLWTERVIPSKAMRDGDYIAEEGNLVPIETQHPSSSTMSLSKRDKHGDLQKLVEEQEEPVDDDIEEGNENIVSVHTETVPPIEMYPSVLKITATRYLKNIKLFFKHLMDPTSRVATDVYSYMFMCDFFNFFVILMGYSSFGTQQGDGGVTSYLEDNRVPLLFLLMLIFQFMLIIMDRAIYLRRYICGKVLFQFVQILFLHTWLFVFFPIMTERSFNSVIPPQIYYMVKCFYLLLSAYQIRCGYPTRILGNFLCKGYNYLNMGLFKVFMSIPFLFELRSVMDWMWTDTSMTIFDWIKMEDIFAHIFVLKCTRHVESEYPQPRGERKSVVIKYLMGGAILFIIILVIWFPMVFFSLGNTVGESNPPFDVTVEVRIGPYEPIYQMTAQTNAIYSFNQKQYQTLTSVYRKEKVATTFISNYEAGDIAAVVLSCDSSRVWGISPPDRSRMEQEIMSDFPLTIHLQYTVRHKSNTKEDSGIIREEVHVDLPAMIDGKFNDDRLRLYQMIQNGTLDGGVEIPVILPKFLKVTNRGTAKAISVFMDGAGKNYDTDKASSFRNVNILLNKEAPNNTVVRTFKEWWDIKEEFGDYNDRNYLSKIPFRKEKSLVIYTFNDKIFPATLSILTGGGIIGLYTTFVLVMFRVIRGSFFSGIFAKIIYEDIPYVERIYNLCRNIFLAREVGDFVLEEDLFAKLIFLYRSPETMIKWTRPPEESIPIEYVDDH